jgi:succinyl-CoA synthetase beta subunit
VASQEQFHSAYGLAKAFNEVNVSVPVVVRLGGNSEERACEILTDACDKLPGVVEGYGKDDTPAACASRFATLVSEAGDIAPDHHRFIPSFVGEDTSASFPIDGGRVWIDLANCDDIASQLVIEHGGGLFERDEQGHPRLAISEDEAAKKDSEFVACEVECLRAGRPVIFVDLEIPGLDELLLAAGEVD